MQKANPEASFFRIAPTSERATYAPSSVLEFKLPAANLLQGGTTRLEFRLTCEQAGAVITQTEFLCLPRFSGAHAVVRELLIQSPTYGVLDRMANYPSWVSLLNSQRWSVGNSLQSKAGRELIMPNHYTSREAIRSARNGSELFVCLELETDLLRQHIDLQKMGGLTVSVTLSTAAKFFVRDARQTTAAETPTFSLSEVYLTGAYLSGMPAPKNIVYRQIVQLENTIRSGTDIVSTTVAAQQCIGMAATFVRRAALDSTAAGNDDYELETVPTLSELAWRVGGVSEPNSYRIDAVQGGDDSEARAGALKAIGAAGWGEALFSGPSSVNENNEFYPAYSLGTPLPGEDLTAKPFAMEVRSAITAAAPYLVTMHFINVRAI